MGPGTQGLAVRGGGQVTLPPQAPSWKEISLSAQRVLQATGSPVSEEDRLYRRPGARRAWAVPSARELDYMGAGKNGGQGGGQAQL